MSAEKRYLRQKAKHWATSFKSSRLRSCDAWHCFTATIMKTIEYPLVATTFTKKECAYFMAPILRFGLNSVRLQNRLPSALVYAPSKYQGIGLHDPWVTQLITHLHLFLRHSFTSSIPGTLLKTNIENLVMELGSGRPIWELHFPTWEPIITPSWLKATWHDMFSTGLYVRWPHQPIPLARLHDQYLMDCFVAQHPSPTQLRSLNEV